MITITIFEKKIIEKYPDNEEIFSCNEEIFNTLFPNVNSILKKNLINLSMKFSYIQQIPYLQSSHIYFIESLNKFHDGNYTCSIFDQNGRKWLTGDYRIKTKRKSFFIIKLLKNNEKIIIIVAEFVILFFFIYLNIPNF